MRVLGIDPGVTGAWSVVEVMTGAPPAVLALGDLPVKTVRLSKRDTKRLAVGELESVLGDALAMGVDRVMIERLTGAPGINSTTAFSLGWTAGALDTVMSNLGVAYMSAHPSVWKRALMVPADKSAARRRATVLFQSDKHWPREADHNRAEAALIGLYGALTRKGA